MRRTLASLLLALFSFPLIGAPIALANQSPEVPACCQRDGKHHCSRTDGATSAPSSGSALVSTCPLFGQAQCLPHGPSLLAFALPLRVFGVPVSASVLPDTIEFLQQIVFFSIPPISVGLPSSSNS